MPEGLRVSSLLVLYLGCIAGFIFAHTSNYFPFTMYISEKNFALLGMAGIMSGVMHLL